jgi:Restriction Enzyme Adenine Methylase Associated
MQLGRSPVSLSDLLQAGLLRPGQKLWFRRKREIRAEVTASGTIRLAGREYTSPSTAGKAASQGSSTNGWVAWYVKEGDEWTDLAALRERLSAS